MGGTVGLQVRDGQGFQFDTNAFELQSASGITSAVALEAANNWWGDPSGPASIGDGVNVQPLDARPACVPAP
ncbi:MAG: hypothetical protein M3380_10210 [Chloroflexota bacterium]|nr:hypothetical protein [Chloroflexota bacterium]